MDWYQCVAWLDRGGLCLLLRANVDHVLVTILEEGFSVALRVTTGPREDRLEILQSLDRPKTARFFWFPFQVWLLLPVDCLTALTKKNNLLSLRR